MFVVLFIFNLNLSFPKDSYKTIRNDSKYLISAPTRWDLLSYLRILGMSTAVLSTGYFDEDIHDFVQSRKTNWDYIIVNLAHFGGENGAVLVGAFYLSSLYIWGAIKEDESLKRFAFKSAEAVAYMGIIIGIIKVLVGRNRPDFSNSAYVFTPPGLDDEKESFPSGHAGLAFALATSTARRYKNPVVRTFAYGLATLVALSRVYRARHWPSDILAGAIIGTSVAHCVFNSR